MQPNRRRWRTALGVLAASLLLFFLILRTDKAGELVCQQLRDKLPQLLGVEVELDQCALEPLTASVELTGISFALVEPKLAFAAQAASISLRGFFVGGVSLQDIELVRPSVELSIPEAGASDSTDECALRALNRVRVARLRIVDGSLLIRLPENRSIKLEGVAIDAALGKREATVTLDGRGGSLVVNGRTIRVGKLALESTLEVESGRLEIQRAEANLEGVKVTGAGTVESLCDALPALDLTLNAWLPVESLPRLGVAVPSPSGQLLARATVGGKVGSMLVRGEVQGSRVSIGPYAPGDFLARASWNGGTVLLEEFFSRAGDGEVRISGELSLTSGFPMTAKVETTDASFAQILGRAGVRGSWVEFPASVKGTLSGTLSPSPVLSGDVEFHTGQFILAARPWDGPQSAGIDILRFAQSSGQFHLGINANAVSFEDISIRAGPRDGTKVSGTVTLYPQRRALDVDINADELDLSDFGSISEMPWSGYGHAHVSVKGPFAAIEVEGDTTLRDFTFQKYALGVVQSPLRYQAGTLSFPAIAGQKGQTPYFGEVALLFGTAGLHTRATVQLTDGRVEDVVDILAGLSPTMQTVQDGVLTGKVSALAAIDSPARALNGVIAASVREARFLKRRLGDTSFIARFDEGKALVFEPAVFEGPLGRFAFEGRWGFDGPLRFSLGIQEGSLSELVDPAAEKKTPLTGTFVASANITGETEQILVDAHISSPSVNWKTHALGPLRLDAKMSGRELEAAGTLFEGLEGTLTMNMRHDWPFQSKLSVNIADAAPFLPDAASAAVQLKGQVEIKGPLLDIAKSTARAHFEEVAVTRGEVTTSNTEPVVLAYTAGAIEVTSLELKGPTTELSAAGSWGPVNVDLKTRGSIDLRLLSSFAGQFERTFGRVDFTAAFGGPIRAPSLAGQASLTDVRLQLTGKDLTVRALSGRAEFSESRVIIQDVEGFLNEGRIRGRGDIRLDRFKVKTLEAQLDLEDVPIPVQPDVPATLTGSLLLASRNLELFQLSGALDVVKFRYTQPLALDSLIANARAGALPSDVAPKEWLRLDVDLRTAGDVRIESNLAGVPVLGVGRVDARLAGQLKLSGTNIRPVLIGAVETQDGSQAFFRGNTFNVQRGQLQFNGLWPTFDLSAQSQIREYVVSVKAFGRFEDPKVSLTSDPPLSDTDILSLLTLGVTSREQLTGRSGFGLAAEALMSASGLDQQVQRFLSQSSGLLKDPQVKLTTSFNENTGTAEPAVSLESRVVVDNIKVGITKPVTGRGTKAHVEYRINQRVSMRLQWDDQNQNTSLGNPGVELRFPFQWE